MCGFQEGATGPREVDTRGRQLAVLGRQSLQDGPTGSRGQDLSEENLRQRRAGGGECPAEP